MNRREMIAKINRLRLKLELADEKCLRRNCASIKFAVRGLITHAGEGYRRGDYYAQDRYYMNSVNKDIKNIRIVGGDVVVKAFTMEGLILPETVDVDGISYMVKGIEASSFR